MPEPEELATEAIEELDAAVGELKELLALLDNGKDDLGAVETPLAGR